LQHTELYGSSYTDFTISVTSEQQHMVKHENLLYFAVDRGFGPSPSENSLMVGNKGKENLF